jgi:hypothetical protein
MELSKKVCTTMLRRFFSAVTTRKVAELPPFMIEKNLNDTVGIVHKDTPILELEKLTSKLNDATSIRD